MNNEVPRNIPRDTFNNIDVKFMKMHIYRRVDFTNMKSLEIVNCNFAQINIAHLGPILKSATPEKRDRKSVITELLRLKRNGFHLNHIYKDSHQNSVQSALLRNDMHMLRVRNTQLTKNSFCGKS